MISKIKHLIFQINPPPSIRRIGGLIKTLWNDIEQTKLMLHSSSMCYMSLGSIIPSLAVTFSIISVFQPLTDPDADWFMQLRNFILTNLAPEAGQEMVVFMEQFLERIDVTRISVTGFGFLFVIVILLLRNIEIALNNVWQVSDERSPFMRFLYFWVTITLGALCLSIAIPILAKLDAITEWVPFLGNSTDAVAIDFQAFSTFLITFIFFSILHKVGPNCYVSFKAAVVGGLAATILIRLASRGFTIYLEKSDWYEDIYGALAVVPLFLLWLFIGWLIILFSSIIAWRTQHGLDLRRETDNEYSDQTESIQSQANNLHLRAILPVLCVFIVGQRFREAKGKGITGAEIIKKIGLPPIWVKQSLMTAECCGLLIMERARKPSHENGEDILHLEVFPSFPLDQLSLASLLERLYSETIDWLTDQDSNLPLEIHHLAEHIYKNLQEEQGDISIASLLSSVEPKKPETKP